MDMEIYEPEPGRTSLVAKIAGLAIPAAPSLTLLGHTDVVPANARDWRHDPFGGELIDGEVWGRGAIDMLNLTATMATGFRHLARDGFRPAGDLTYVAVADEEALGTHGAEWLCRHAADDVHADYVITESGGFPMDGADGDAPPAGHRGREGGLLVHAHRAGAPRATAPSPCAPTTPWSRRPRSSAASTSTGPRPRCTRRGPASSSGIGLPARTGRAAARPDRIDEFCEELPLLGLARQAHACTHTTMAPTMMRAGTKINVIPDRVELEVDIRSLPGWDTDRRPGHARRGRRGPGRGRGDRVPVRGARPPPPPSTRRCGMRWNGSAGSSTPVPEPCPS